MKVLFSTDWHLGYEMGGANRVDRLPDQLRQLKLIAGYIEQHGVDVLAVAGDVFEAQERGRARVVVQSLLEVLRPSLRRGLQLVMIAGNHDRDYFMETASAWLDAGGAAANSRIVLCTRPALHMVEAGGERLTFVLLPFPTPARYGLTELPEGGAAARNEAIGRAFAEKMEELRRQAAARQAPAVLLAHVTVEGTEVGPHRLSPRDDVVVRRDAFPSFEMTVIGHIHKQERFGSAHFYYAGVLDRMDIGERDYETRVLLADIGPQGVRRVDSLPLDPTPFEEVIASSEEELERWRRSLARPEETLVKLRLRVPFGTYTAGLIEAARRLFPRLYGNVEHEWLGVPEAAPSVAGLDARDVEGTVQRYLEEQVPDAEERSALLVLVRELQASLATGGAA